MPIENPGPGATGTGAGIVREQQHLLDTTPKETRQGWRDLIQVHPAADLFPMMSEDELRELGNDIEKNGLQHAVVFWTPTRREDLPYRGKNKGRPKQKYLLDGRNRLEAIQRTVTDPEERAEAIADAIYLDAYGYDGAKLLCANIDPFEYVVSANLHRRHLAREQKRELVETLLKARPERSDQETAKIAKVSPTTVGDVRAKLEETGEVSKLDTRTGADGVKQPVRKLSPHSREITPEKLAEIRAEAPREADPPATIDQLADRKDALRVLDETVRLLSQRSAEVLALPRQVRLGRAMAVMDALGLGVGDLVPESRR